MAADCQTNIIPINSYSSLKKCSSLRSAQARSPSEDRTDGRINVVQTLLKGFLNIQPAIELPPRLCGSLAVNYNCHHIVLKYFKQKQEALEESLEGGGKVEEEKKEESSDMAVDAPPATAPAPATATATATATETAVAKRSSPSVWCVEMQFLLKQLGESDVVFAMQRNQLQDETLKKALSLEMYGNIEAASKLYEKVVVVQTPQNVAVTDTKTGTGTEEQPAAVAVPVASVQTLTIDQSDAGIWEERWMETNRALGQWGVLLPYAKSSNNTELQLECCWKTRDWKSVHDLCR